MVTEYVFNPESFLLFTCGNITYNPITRGPIPIENFIDNAVLYIPNTVESVNNVRYYDDMNPQYFNLPINEVQKDGSISFSHSENSRFSLTFELVNYKNGDDDKIKSIIKFFVDKLIHDFENRIYKTVFITPTENILPEYNNYYYAGIPSKRFLAFVERVHVENEPLVYNKNGEKVFTNLTVSFINFQNPTMK